MHVTRCPVTLNLHHTHIRSWQYKYDGVGLDYAHTVLLIHSVVTSIVVDNTAIGLDDS